MENGYLYLDDVMRLAAGLQRFGLEITSRKCPNPGSSTAYWIQFRSDRCRYTITVDGLSNYLGAQASNIITGKGNDLSDGKATMETWLDILGDIISYECSPNPQFTR